MTQGEKVIRPDFSKDEIVKEIKTLYAQLYDKVSAESFKKYDTSSTKNMTEEEYKEKLDGGQEVYRLLCKALDELETSAMYAVKALTV